MVPAFMAPQMGVVLTTKALVLALGHLVSVVLAIRPFLPEALRGDDGQDKCTKCSRIPELGSARCLLDCVTAVGSRHVP